MDILTYLHKNGQFIEKGQDKSPDILKRGLVLGQFPIYDGNWTVVSRMDRLNFQGPISDVFCVKEVRTKNPVLLKVNPYNRNGEDEDNLGIFPLDFISDELGRLHGELINKKYSGSIGYSMTDSIKTSGPDYGSNVTYLAHHSDSGIEVGIDPLDRKKPGVVNRMKGVDLEAKLVIKSWSRGNSPTAVYMGTENMYNTDNFMTMLNDVRFKGQMLPQIADKNLGDALKHLNISTEDLGKYVVLFGRK